MPDEDLLPAVVTGAGSGIGRAIAIRLARADYLCVLAGRRLEPLEETAGLIAGEGASSLSIAADVTSEDGRTAILGVVDHLDAPWRVLVNNAGGSHVAPRFAQDAQTWRYEFALNVEAAAFRSFEAIRRMAKTDGGSIVNIASVYGIVALNNAFYLRGHPPTGNPQRPVHAAAWLPFQRCATSVTEGAGCRGGALGARVNTVSPGAIDVVTAGLGRTRQSVRQAGTNGPRWASTGGRGRSRLPPSRQRPASSRERRL